MEKVAKIEALKADGAFMAKVAEVKTPDELIKLFAEQGVDVTEEEIKAAVDVSSANGEVDESTLENVTGGSVLGTILAIGGVIAGISAVKGFFDAFKCK